MLQHLVFVKEIALVTELFAQVAEQGGGLVAHLARAESGGELGQRLQLGADAEAIGDRGRGHAAEPAEPGDDTRAAVGQVVAAEMRRARLGRELTLEAVDDDAQALGVYPAVLSSQEATDDFFDFGKGRAPLPQHETSIPNRCSRVNTLAMSSRQFTHAQKIFPPPARRLETRTQAARPGPTPLPSPSYPHRMTPGRQGGHSRRAAKPT